MISRKEFNIDHIKYIQRAVPDIDLTEQECNELDCLPIESYSIEESAISNWDTSKSIIPLMKLEKNRANGIVYLKDQVYFTLRLNYLNNEWHVSSGGIGRSSRLGQLCFKDKKKISYLYVYTTNGVPITHCVVYKDKGVFKCYQGKFDVLLVDFLKRERARYLALNGH